MRLLVDARGVAGPQERIHAEQDEFWKDILPRVLERFPGGAICLARSELSSFSFLTNRLPRPFLAEVGSPPADEGLQALCLAWGPDAFLSTCSTHCDTRRTIAVIEPGLSPEAFQLKASCVVRAQHCIAIREQDLQAVAALAGDKLPRTTVLYQAGNSAPINATIVANFIAKFLQHQAA